ncbi:MAG: DUF4340 domain-containing protein [Halioglobus sp.]|jgi:hypothetical protein
MTNARLWLTLLLVLQLALATGLVLTRGAADGGGTPQPLLPVAASAVDRMVISDGESQATVLRQDGGWFLPDAKLPASARKVNDILARLGETVTEWPVATTESSQARFAVTEAGFQRRVQLFRGDEQVAELYLGTSPGFRKVHLRRAGEDAVYAVNLNTFDLPASEDAWLDQSLLAVAEPTRIVGPDYTLTESEDGVWTLADGEATKGTAMAPLDDDRARQLVSALANLRVQSLASGDPAAAQGQAVTIEVETADGSYRYDFYRDDESYYVRRNDRAPVFTLSQYDYDRITGMDRAELVHKSEETETDEPGGESET